MYENRGFYKSLNEVNLVLDPFLNLVHHFGLDLDGFLVY